MIEQCVVRTFPKGWTHPTAHLEQKLNDGWTVKHISTFKVDSKSDGNEYILEREKRT